MRRGAKALAGRAHLGVLTVALRVELVHGRGMRQRCRHLPVISAARGATATARNTAARLTDQRYASGADGPWARARARRRWIEPRGQPAACRAAHRAPGAGRRSPRHRRAAPRAPATRGTCVARLAHSRYAPARCSWALRAVALGDLRPTALSGFQHAEAPPHQRAAPLPPACLTTRRCPRPIARARPCGLPSRACTRPERAPCARAMMRLGSSGLRARACQRVYVSRGM